jgi:hypothetical protein
MNDGLERMWKEAGVAWVDVLFQHSFEDTNESTEIPIKIVGVQAEIRNKYLRNTGQEWYSTVIIVDK